MSDKLFKVIEDLQSDKSLNSLSEADISLGVVLRILDALSWSTYDRREVSPEYSVENRWVDYALLIGNTPQVFIEVKKGGEPLEKHQEQLLDYAFRQGIKVAILTNGVTWWFYLALRAVSWEQRKVATVELDKQDKEEIAQKLVDLLGKENVRSGKAVQNAEVLYRNHRISTALPKAWNQLLSESEGLIVDLLVKKTTELCGEETDKSEVKRFLSAHLQDIEITSPSAIPEPVQAPEPKPPDRVKGTKPKAFTVTKPKAFTFKGQRCEVESWQEVPVKLCEILYRAHEDRFEQQVLEMKSPTGVPHFSRDSSILSNPKMINGTGIYVGVGTRGTKSAPTFAKKIIFLFGYDEKDLLFETQ